MSDNAQLDSSVKRRSGNIFDSQKRRAKKDGKELDYTRDELRVLVAAALARGACEFCAGPLTGGNFSADHSRPVSRGGAHDLTNIVICCETCNQIKGNMTAGEFDDLLRIIDSFAPVARKSVRARLRAGGRVIHN